MAPRHALLLTKLLQELRDMIYIETFTEAVLVVIARVRFCGCPDGSGLPDDRSGSTNKLMAKPAPLDT